MIPTSTVRRVVARFAPQGDTDSLPEEAPVLTADQLQEELERRLGPLAASRIFPPPSGEGARARWEATTLQGTTVRGTVEVRTLFLDGLLLVWPEIEVVGAGSKTAAELPRQLLQQRLEQVASRLRRLLMEVRVRPDVPAHELAGKLRRVVELAEIAPSA